MENRSDFTEAKVGDDAIVMTIIGGEPSYKLAKITKVNKQTFKVNNSHDTFYKRDGRRRNSGYLYKEVYKYNTEDWNTIQKEMELYERKKKAVLTIYAFYNQSTIPCYELDKLEKLASVIKEITNLN